MTTPWAGTATMLLLGDVNGDGRLWDGKQSEHSLAWDRGGSLLPAIHAGNTNVVTRFPVDGRVMHADPRGDGKEEVIIFAGGDRAGIYACALCDLSAPPPGVPPPPLKRPYNFARYTAGETPHLPCYAKAK